jgi:hypothetical protein
MYTLRKLEAKFPILLVNYRIITLSMGHPHIFTKLINVCVVTKGLIDTGSQITTVTKEFHSSLTPKPEMKSLEVFKLEVSVVNGDKLPYLGYVQSD